MDEFYKLDHEAPAVLAMKRMINIGVEYRKAGQLVKALEAYDDVINNYQDTEDKLLSYEVAETLLAKSVILRDLGRLDEELKTYDFLIEKYLDFEIVEFMGFVAFALGRKAEALDVNGRKKEAIKIYGDIIARYEDRTEKGLLYQVVQTLIHQGMAFIELNLLEEAKRCFDKALLKNRGNEDGSFVPLVAMAGYYMGVVLVKLGREDDALRTFEIFTKNFNKGDEDEEIANWAACALVDQGNILCGKKQFEEGIKCYKTVVARYGNRKEMDMPSMVAIALFNSLDAYIKLKQHNHALEAYWELSAKYGNSEDEKLRKLVATASQKIS